MKLPFTVVFKREEKIDEEDIVKSIRTRLKEKWKDDVYIHKIEPLRPNKR